MGLFPISFIFSIPFRSYGYLRKSIHTLTKIALKALFLISTLIKQQYCTYWYYTSLKRPSSNLKELLYQLLSQEAPQPKLFQHNDSNYFPPSPLIYSCKGLIKVKNDNVSVLSLFDYLPSRPEFIACDL